MAGDHAAAHERVARAVAPSSPSPPPPPLQPQRPLPLRARVLLDARHRAAKRPRAPPGAPPAPPKRRRSASQTAAASLESLIASNVLRARSRVPAGFVRASRANVIDARLREIVVDWLMEVGAEYAAPTTTLALAVNYLDRMLACSSITRHTVQPIAVVCMLLACKMDHSDPPSMLDGVAMCDRSADTAMLLDMETSILLRLNFDLNVFTPCSVLPLLLRHVMPSDPHHRAKELASVLAHVAMLHPNLSTRSPATVALACIVLAIHSLGLPFSTAVSLAQPDVRRHLCSPIVIDSAVLLWQKWLTLHDTSAHCPSRWLLKQWPHLSPTTYTRDEPISPASLRDLLSDHMQRTEVARVCIPPSPLTTATPVHTPRRALSVAPLTPSSLTTATEREPQAPPTPSSHTTAAEEREPPAPRSHTCLLSSSPLLDDECEQL